MTVFLSMKKATTVRHFRGFYSSPISNQIINYEYFLIGTQIPSGSTNKPRLTANSQRVPTQRLSLNLAPKIALARLTPAQLSSTQLLTRTTGLQGKCSIRGSALFIPFFKKVPVNSYKSSTKIHGKRASGTKNLP